MASCSHRFIANMMTWKTASYAVMHFCVAIVVAFALTGDWRAALAIGIVEPIVQTFAFALHDQVWAARGEGAAAVTVTEIA